MRQIKFGESILVLGCGGVGLNLIQAASLKTAYPIIAIDNNLDKEKLSLKCGANFFFDDINSYFDEKVDVIIDTTGIPQVISKAINKLSGNGRLILVGQPTQSIEILNAINMFNGIGKKIFATQVKLNQMRIFQDM